MSEIIDDSEAAATSHLQPPFSLLAATLFFFFISIAPNSPLQAEVSAQLRGAEKLVENDEAIRQQMMVISRQLGVSCTSCHSTKSFAANDKREYRVAKEHMKITQALIDNGFDGKEKHPKADCYMCHRGKLVPDWKEEFDPLTTEKTRGSVK
ncbi:MAG: hypothetical protein C5B49_07155 [Bdellovibrio sp.]|nr:MAG: hypothetical protein C5B49_07155 [Bdellovibrio sp.]